MASNIGGIAVTKTPATDYAAGQANNTAREAPTNIDMTKSTWTLLIGYLVTRRSSTPRLPETLAWFVTLVTTVPLLTAKNFDPLIGPPEFWHYSLLLIAFGSAVMLLGGVLKGFWIGLVDTDFTIRGKARHLPRGLEWVPCNVAAFVQFVERRLQVEQQRATESANTLAINELRSTVDELVARFPKDGGSGA